MFPGIPGGTSQGFWSVWAALTELKPVTYFRPKSVIFHTLHTLLSDQTLQFSILYFRLSRKWKSTPNFRPLKLAQRSNIWPQLFQNLWEGLQMHVRYVNVIQYPMPSRVKIIPCKYFRPKSLKNHTPEGPKGGGELKIKRTGVLFLRFWCLLGCSASKGPQWEFWAEKIWQEIICCLRIGTNRGEKNLSHAHKTDSWYLLGALFKNFRRAPSSF